VNIMLSNIVSIIPARGGSKGVPDKNIKPLAGIPLIAHTINASKQSQYIQRTIVSTDSEKIANIARYYGSEIIMRPDNLALDETPTEPVIGHVLDVLSKKENYYPEHIILLQPTSPLRTTEDIDNAIKKYNSDFCDSLLSVCSSHAFIWKNEDGFGAPINYDFRKRPRSQEMHQYRENGAIYIFKRDLFLAKSNRLGGKISLYEMEEGRSVEIDTAFDFILVEHFLNNSLRCKNTALTLSPDLRRIIKKLRIIITDVDGVLTDGGMYYSNQGEVMKQFNTKDGMGLELIRKKGLKVAIMTKEKSDIVLQRAMKLKVDDVYINVEDKLELTKKLAAKHDIKMDEICYIGDDVNDIAVLRNVGFPVSVANAVANVMSVAKYITKTEGGKGAVREVCDLILSVCD